MRQKEELSKMAARKLADYRSRIIRFLAEKNIHKDEEYDLLPVEDAPYSIKVTFKKSPLVSPETFNKELGTTGIVGNMSVILNFEKLIKGTKEVEVIEKPSDRPQYPPIHFLNKKKSSSVENGYPYLNSQSN